MTAELTAPTTGEQHRPPRSFTIHVGVDPLEQGRVVTALAGRGILMVVPDTETALEVLHGAARAAASAADPPTEDEPPLDLVVDDEVVRLGALVVDRRRAAVTWDDVPVVVSHLELEVLRCLVGSPGVVWSYDELHRAAWGTAYVGDRDGMHSLVKRLRRKLVDAGVGVELLSVRGVGFQLVVHRQRPVAVRPTASSAG